MRYKLTAIKKFTVEVDTESPLFVSVKIRFPEEGLEMNLATTADYQASNRGVIPLDWEIEEIKE